MTQKIIQIGDTRLLEQSEIISDISSGAVQELAIDLLDTVKAHMDSAAGLSAVQIGVLQRMFVVKLKSNNPDEDPTYEIVINPEVISQSNDVSTIWEGCMSINVGKKRLYGPVSRSRVVSLRYFDLEGNQKEISGKGFQSHLLQHELDHLNGTLFLQYIQNPKNIWNEDELDAYLDKHGEFPPIQ